MLWKTETVVLSSLHMDIPHTVPAMYSGVYGKFVPVHVHIDVIESTVEARNDGQVRIFHRPSIVYKIKCLRTMICNDGQFRQRES